MGTTNRMPRSTGEEAKGPWTVWLTGAQPCREELRRRHPTRQHTPCWPLLGAVRGSRHCVDAITLRPRSRCRAGGPDGLPHGVLRTQDRGAVMPRTGAIRELDIHFCWDEPRQRVRDPEQIPRRKGTPTVPRHPFRGRSPCAQRAYSALGQGSGGPMGPQAVEMRIA